MSRKAIFHTIAEEIYKIKKDSPILVGIDGVDGAGKTFFAEGLRDMLQSLPNPVVLASVDDFHNPSIIRYRRGKDSPEGFYLDSFHYPLLKQSLLDPFRKGEGQYTLAGFDLTTDSERIEPFHPVLKNSILVIEGIFLFRPELVHYFDIKIFLDVDFEVTLKRNIHRSTDQAHIGSTEKIIARYTTRYMPGQKLYLAQADPTSKADIIINNSDFENPVMTSMRLQD
ncbi:MAG: hypothetical protein KBD15_00290 [Candidatus Magasanikbacteria bacterium]|jgi:uridine kinase|nr:hypothetical protein [Candidatus Magasanikbacteria bacterium]